MGKPIFISFEGIDGAGKSSHIPWLSDLLLGHGQEVVITREPGGTPIGEQLRSMLLANTKSGAAQMDVNAELMLMFAARRQHLSEVIEPALAQGKIVISDRFVDSTYAFQGGGGCVPYSRIEGLDVWCGGARPDLTFLFDLPTEVAQARIADSRVLDRFESEAQDYHERVRAAYLQRAELDPERVKIIDASRSIELIRGELIEVIRASGIV